MDNESKELIREIEEEAEAMQREVQDASLKALQEAQTEQIEEFKKDYFNWIKQHDFIEDLKSEILKFIPTSPDWAEDNALVLFSTACHNVEFSTTMGRVPLNIWLIGIAPSSAVKTLSIKEYVIPIVEQRKQLGGNQDIDYELPSTFTPESITEWLSSGHQTRGIIIRDEVSSMFKETSGRGYNAQLSEYLISLYDGRIGLRYTIKHGAARVPNCYTTFLGATNPYLYTILDASDFTLGLGNRIAWEVFDISPKELTATELFSRIPEIRQEKQRRIMEFATILSYIDRLTALRVEIKDNSRAGRILVSFRNEINSKALSLNQKDKSSIEALYISKSFVLALKLAALKVVSRSYTEFKDKKTDEPITLYVSKEDADWAVSKARRFNENFKKMLVDWSIKPRKKPVETVESYYNVVEQYFNNSDRIFARPEFMDRTKLSSYDASQILKTLIEAAKIEKLTDEEIRALSEDICKKHHINRKKELPWVFRILEDESK